MDGRAFLCPLHSQIPNILNENGKRMLTSNVWSGSGISACLGYYNHLSQEEQELGYYRSQEQGDTLKGKIAERLTISGKTLDDKIFSDLLHGIYEGHKLRVRDVEGAKVGIDITVSVPKSISIVYEFTKDPVIKQAMLEANTEMMTALEAYAQYQNNSQTQRNYVYSGELLRCEFLHSKSRPSRVKVGEKTVIGPSMNYHIHNFLFTTTYNKEKQRLQALEAGEIFRRLPYFEKCFHAHLSKSLREAGYQIEHTRYGYELAGISNSVIERFSNRTAEIEQYALENNITDPKAKGEIGAKLRLSKKASTIKEEDLLDHWKSRLSSEELANIYALKGRTFDLPEPLSIEQVVERSLSHHLEREAAAQLPRVMATALSYSYGHYLPQDIRDEINKRENLVFHEIQGMDYLTSRELIQAEEKLISLSTEGKGRLPALHPSYEVQKDFLNEQQVKVVEAFLSSTDRLMILKGRAGTGKSTTLNAIKKAAGLVGKSTYAASPTTQAANVLISDGIEATTVAALLHSPELQERLQNQILILDEAGLTGLHDLNAVLQLSKERNFRLLMSGDTRQHSPISHEALSILERDAQVKTVTLNKIMRQKPDAYKAAISKLATPRRTLEGYMDLDKKLDAIKEEPDHDKRLNQLTDEYIGSISQGRSALIVSPTNYEGDLINQLCRNKLKEKGRITGKDHVIDRLVNCSFTEAEKQRISNYSEGMMVRMSRNQKGGLWAGNHYEVMPRKDNKSVQVRDQKSGKTYDLPTAAPKHFEVFQKTQSPLAKGDLIRLTQNTKALQGNKLSNGSTHRIEAIHKNNIKLDNGKTVPKDFYHWKPGYAETSHSSQGKTTDDVFISMSDLSMAAVNEQTLYVSASRGRHSVSIYTSSKEDLKKAVARSATRVTAREVAAGHDLRVLRQKQQVHNQALNEKKIANERIHETRQRTPGELSKEL
ncbi:MAG: relaxase domain-containing protein [Cyclobacteriaceae bacterium]